MDKYGDFFETHANNRMSEIMGSVIDGFLFGGIAAAIMGIIFSAVLIPIWMLINKIGK